MYNLVIEKIIINRDVNFDEGKSWNWESTDVSRQNVKIQLVVPGNSEMLKNSGDNSNGDTIRERIFGSITSSVSQGNQEETSSVDESPVQKVRSLREIYESCLFALNLSDPSTYEEAAKSDH